MHKAVKALKKGEAMKTVKDVKPLKKGESGAKHQSGPKGARKRAGRKVGAAHTGALGPAPGRTSRSEGVAG